MPDVGTTTSVAVKMSEYTEDYRDSQFGNLLFRLRSRDFYAARLAADEWAYYLQHRMPMTQGLHQQIATFNVPFPTRVIPTDRVEDHVSIPEPTYHAPYIDPDVNHPFAILSQWPIDPLPGEKPSTSQRVRH